MEDFVCCVCWEKVSIQAKTSCGHFLCENCAPNLCTTSCPMCRFDPIENIYITEDVLENIKQRNIDMVLSIQNNFNSHDPIYDTDEGNDMYSHVNYLADISGSQNPCEEMYRIRVQPFEYEYCMLQDMYPSSQNRNLGYHAVKIAEK